MAVVEVLRGGAATGKTTRLLDIYRQGLRSAAEAGEPGTALWLSPSFESVREIQGRLLNASLTAAFQPNVMRFDEFALKILERTPRPVVRLTDTMRRAMLRRIVDRHLAERKLSHFAGIARTSGFVDLLSGFISEMKRAEIWPETYLEVCGREGRASNRDRELTSLYDEYQRTLLARNLYDAEGRFWFAREAIRQGAWAPFEKLRLVVVDGFTDFLFTQYEILQSLAGRAGRMLLSLPLEDDSRRPDLFAKPRRVLEKLRERMEVEIVVAPLAAGRQEPPPPVALPASLRQVADHVFCNPRLNVPAVDLKGVEVLAIAGGAGERQTIAARIKALLHRGVPANEIVLVLRWLGDADLWVEHFQASGIPVSCEAGLVLARTSPIRALLTALRVEAEDWPFDRLMSLLDSNYFAPRWEGIDVFRSTRLLARELRRLKVPFGREPILTVLQGELESLSKRIAERREEEVPTREGEAPAREGEAPAEPFPDTATRQESPPDPAKIADDDRRHSDFAAICEFVQKLDGAFSPLRRKQTVPDWAATLLAFSKELGLHPSSRKMHAAREDDPEIPIWDAFDRVLVEISKAERCLRDSDGELTLAEFATELNEHLRHVQMASICMGDGRVRILDAEHVRNIDVPYLFVAGLTEDSFPGGQGEDCVLQESERRKLRQFGLDLRDRDQHQQDEMLLFYGVVTRARKQLVLSYPAVDSKGNPLNASPYLVALQSILPGLSETLDERLDPIPEEDRVLTPADQRVYAMNEALHRRPGRLADLLGRPATGPAILNALSAVDMAVSRFHTPEFSEYEGQLKVPQNVATAAERFGPGHEFSVSQLEGYLKCPFRFLMEQVYRIRELDPPDVRTDYATRGIVAHDVLARLHAHFRELLPPDQPLPSGDVISQRFIELVAEQMRTRPRRSAVQRTLARIEEKLLRDFGVEYGRQWEAYRKAYESWPNPPRPAHLELTFGQPRISSPERTAGGLAALALGEGPGQVTVAGIIDRVDVGEREGRPVYVVVDYKTGRTIPLQTKTLQSALVKGRALQVVLYSLIVQKLGLAGEGSEPWTLGYWSLAGRGFAPPDNKAEQALAAEQWQALQTTLEAMIPQLAAGMRSGQFPVQNDDAHCTRTCSFRTVCRVSQIRALPPSLAKTAEIVSVK